MQLVFVHGSGGNHAVWHHQLRAFPGADAVDLPGHPDGALLPSVEAYADWLAWYLDRSGYGPCVVVGHSIGGAVAMACTLRNPGRIDALVLIGSGARLRVVPETIASLDRAVDDPAQLAPVVRHLLKRVDRDLREELVREGERVGAAAFANDLRACDRFDIMDRVGGIDVPTFALCGSEDVMTPPKYSRFLAEKIRGAQVEVIEGGTHYVFLEQPEAVNAAIRRFVDSL